MANAPLHDALENLMLMLRSGKEPGGATVKQAMASLRSARKAADDALLPASLLARLAYLLDKSSGHTLAVACWSVRLLCCTHELCKAQVVADSGIVRRLGTISGGSKRAGEVSCPTWQALLLLADLALSDAGVVLHHQPRLLAL